jgi:hypothetical protein
LLFTDVALASQDDFKLSRRVSIVWHVRRGYGFLQETQIAEHFREKFPYEKGFLAPSVKRIEALSIVSAWPAHKDLPIRT